jgi:glutathione synthase/RimK-type ligase-like ATP-grasp enzyme
MITLIGNPGSRRVKGFAEAAARHGRHVKIVSYTDAICDRCLPPSHGVVRIDSPGECTETSRLILCAGIESLASEGGSPITQREIARLQFARGEILYPRQWFFGFREILKMLETRWNGYHIHWMSTPDSIITAFDKLACLEQWSDAGLPVPHRYPQITSYQQLRELVRDRHARLFLKLRYGYSAMGAIALEWRDSLVRAITSVEVERSGMTRLYVTKRPRVLLRHAEIEWLINTLAAEEVLVEDWLPKARWNGRPFDIRVVTIGGQPCHAVGRANSSPFTNLNLNATRIEREALVQRFGHAWNAIESLSTAAAQQIPGAGMLGIDVLIRPNGKQFTLLEANAFGDYLPGLLYRGVSTWDAQLQLFAATEEAVA